MHYENSHCAVWNSTLCFSRIAPCAFLRFTLQSHYNHFWNSTLCFSEIDTVLFAKSTVWHFAQVFNVGVGRMPSLVAVLVLGCSLLGARVEVAMPQRIGRACPPVFFLRVIYFRSRVFDFWKNSRCREFLVLIGNLIHFSVIWGKFHGSQTSKPLKSVIFPCGSGKNSRRLVFGKPLKKHWCPPLRVVSQQVTRSGCGYPPGHVSELNVSHKPYIKHIQRTQNKLCVIKTYTEHMKYINVHNTYIQYHTTYIHGATNEVLLSSSHKNIDNFARVFNLFPWHWNRMQFIRMNKSLLSSSFRFLLVKQFMVRQSLEHVLSKSCSACLLSPQISHTILGIREVSWVTALHLSNTSLVPPWNNSISCETLCRKHSNRPNGVMLSSRSSAFSFSCPTTDDHFRRSYFRDIALLKV